MIRGVSAGDRAAQAEFAKRYLGPVRAYLCARWKSGAHSERIDDAVQEVFVECLRADGAVARAGAGETGSFRPYLYGLVRNVARRMEEASIIRTERAQAISAWSGVAKCEEDLSRVFDREWAELVMRRAAQLHAKSARKAGDAAVKRVELLRLRFEEGLPIREIAELWQADSAALHHEYAKAREEFRNALREVVAFHQPGTQADVEQEARELLSLLRAE